MSGEGIKAPKREPVVAKEVPSGEEAPAPEGTERREAPEGLGSPPPAAGPKEFFLVEYVKEILRGVRWLRASPKPEQSTLKRVQKGLFRWSRGRKSRIGVVVVLGIVMMSYVIFSAQALNTQTLERPEPPGANNATWAGTGTVSEDGQSEVAITPPDAPFPGTFAHLTIVLTWTDEPASNPTVRNAPDNLGLNITAPDGRSWELAPVSNGRLMWSLEATGEPLGGENWQDWSVVVLGGTMGDEEPISGRPGPCLRCQVDNSNMYNVAADYSW